MKRLFLGLLLAGIAVGGSAFTSATKVAGDIYVTTDGVNYVYIPTGDYDDSACENTPTAPKCSYVVTTEGAPFISRSTGFTAEQAPTLENTDGYIDQLSSDNGLYNP